MLESGIGRAHNLALASLRLRHTKVSGSGVQAKIGTDGRQVATHHFKIHLRGHVGALRVVQLRLGDAIRRRRAHGACAGPA